MKFSYRNFFFPFLTLLYLLVASPIAATAETDETFTLQEKIKIYRQILRTEKTRTVLAEAHLKIAGFLEALGRDTEATAEYLKILLNYPDVGELSKSAEEKLTSLYSKFSDKKSKILGGQDTPEEAKDPAIFFTYIKSLYGTYIDQGKYDKALYLLNKLVNMDRTNQAYYEDIGNIYLNGYNDADKALKYFNKLAQLNPNHPKVYTDIGLAYEKKGNTEDAIKYYSKSIELSPFNSWSMYGLARMEALKLAKEKKLIKNWYFLGPFENLDMKGLEKEYGPEKRIDLVKTYEGINGKKIEWFMPFSYDDSGYVDLNTLFEDNDTVTAFALTYAYSEEAHSSQFRVGADDPISIWLNGKLIFKKKEVLRPAQFDRDTIDVTLKKGWNEILIKTAEAFGRWGFYFRITNEDNSTPLNVIFDPLKNEARAKEICSKLKRQKGLMIARTTLLYGATGLVFLLGVFLLITNIINKVKIRRMKEDFIASVSHELKTPLAAIKMFTETLNMGRVRDSVRVKEYYSTIIRETDRLTRFINKILDFQKIEKRKKIYSFEKVDVKNLLKKAAEIYTKQVQDESLVVEEEYDSNVPDIEIDEDAMLQVFLNLLTNAYKYSTKEKYIKIKTEKADKNILISVIDKGMGISKDKLTKIFDKFYRVDRDSTKDIKGSGIGLAFVKSVIEAHNGRMMVESQINKGSTFMISLPIGE